MLRLLRFSLFFNTFLSLFLLFLLLSSFSWLWSRLWPFLVRLFIRTIFLFILILVPFLSWRHVVGMNWVIPWGFILFEYWHWDINSHHSECLELFNCFPNMYFFLILLFSFKLIKPFLISFLNFLFKKIWKMNLHFQVLFWRKYLWRRLSRNIFVSLVI